jgi:hypothetical protein
MCSQSNKLSADFEETGFFTTFRMTELRVDAPHPKLPEAVLLDGYEVITVVTKKKALFLYFNFRTLY